MKVLNIVGVLDNAGEIEIFLPSESTIPASEFLSHCYKTIGCQYVQTFDFQYGGETLTLWEDEEATFNPPPYGFRINDGVHATTDLLGAVVITGGAGLTGDTLPCPFGLGVLQDLFKQGVITPLSITPKITGESDGTINRH